MTVDLARQKDERGSRHTWVGIDEAGHVRVDRFDHGPFTTASFGGDYEHWLTVPPSELAKLCIALLAERLAGDMQAVDTVAAICRDADVRFAEDSWP